MVGVDRLNDRSWRHHAGSTLNSTWSRWCCLV